MRRGFLTAGSWCLDRNITVDKWPDEDMIGIVSDVELAGGGSACNFAIDMRRLDPTMPVATQGLVGAGTSGDFLVSQADAHGIDRTGLHRSAADSTMTTDAYLSAVSGRRTHILFRGLADALTPDHFDFSGSTARFLHLGLPGIHALMDAPWGNDANGWVTTLRKGHQAGLKCNMELVAGPPEQIRRVVGPCLPHLDTLVVNDFEIGALSGLDVVSGGKTDTRAVHRAAQKVLSLGRMELIVVHYTRGAVLLHRDGTAVEQPSVAIPDAERAGANGAGDAFAAGFFYGLHENWSPQDCLRMGHAAAAASLRSPGTYTSVVSAQECLDLAQSWGWRA